MEKQALYSSSTVAEHPPLPPRSSPCRHPLNVTRRNCFITLGIVFFVLLFWVSRDPPMWYREITGASSSHSRCMSVSNHTNTNAEDIWESITPSKELEWHDCYAGLAPPGSPFKCARLTVPLDYNADTNIDHDDSDNQVHLALVLRPAKNGSTRSSKPPMLINPGGPGGSGTMIALLMASSMQVIFGDDQPIIGFDPRGIGFTVPLSDCWATPPPKSCTGGLKQCPENPGLGMQHRLEWLKQNGAYGFVNSTDVSLKFIEAGQRSVNKMCASRDARHGGKSILRHASTAHVARDMLSIIDAWDRWVDGAVSGTVSTRSDEEKSKLTYWGFSYGTYLGIKFASMFPDRVGRLMLDGVVDAEYYETPVWVESLLDTDKILELFFEFCADNSGCALHREGDTPSSVRKRYNDVINRIQYGPPIIFIHPEYFYPVTLQAEVFRTLVFSMLYSPQAMFPALAVLLDNLFEERYEDFAVMFGDLLELCGGISPDIRRTFNDAQRAVMCSDKTGPVNQTPDEIRDAFHKMAEKSQFADIWMSIMIQCNGWDLFEKDPLAQSTILSSAAARRGGLNVIENNAQINTSFPILFLSNTLDPVTPLKAAVKMATRFSGAGLLEQKSAGHCTASSASRCTAKVLRGYVNEGKVPPPPKFSSKKGEDDQYLLKGEWMTCEADEKIGRNLVKLEMEDEMAHMEEEDRKVLGAMLKIQEVLRDVPMFEVQKRPLV